MAKRKDNQYCNLRSVQQSPPQRILFYASLIYSILCWGDNQPLAKTFERKNVWEFSHFQRKKFLLSAPSYLRWNFDELRDERACQGWWQIEGNRKRFDVVLYGRGIAWIDVNGLKHLAENLSSDSLVDFYKVKSLFQEREIPNFGALFGNNIS